MSQGAEAAEAAEKVSKRKTAALTIRMTQDTRDILDAAAHDERRSVSEMAELWITSASRGEQSYRERIGGSQVAEAIEAMLEFKKTVEAEVGNPLTYLPARDALLAGWKLLIDKALPYTPDTPEGLKYRLATTNLRALCRHTAEMLLAQDANTVSEDLLEYGWKSEGQPNNVFARKESIYTLLMGAADNPMPLTVRYLARRLEEREPPAEIADAVRAIKEAIPPFLDVYQSYMVPRQDAVEKGKALAEAWNPPPLSRR